MSPPPFRSEEDAWEERAKVARWAAEELEACRRVASKLLSSNYMGNSCVEAPPVYDDLTNSLSTGPASWRAALGDQADALASLADSCASAPRTFSGQDLAGALTLGG